MDNDKNCDQIRDIQGTYWCDDNTDVYIGNCNTVSQKVSSQNYPDLENFGAIATCNDYIYFVCWSNDIGRNGFIAELHGTNSAFSGLNPKWEVFPTGIDFDTPTERPSEALVNNELKKANCNKWKPVFTGQPNTGISKPFSGISGINDNAHFIWYDSGKDTRPIYPTSPYVPFAGFDHDEFLIFRFPVKELFKEECLNCTNECECQDDCNCSVCATEITEQQEVLKTKALKKSFVIIGKENNSKRCKAPYSDEACSTLDLPTLEPCFYLHWGDGPKDQMETHDDEIMYITACNPYGNLSFKGLTITSISIIPTPTVGNNGNETIQIIPDRLVRLGDLCGCSCVSQALTLLTCGAKPQDYGIHVEYCIDQIVINQDNKGKTHFPISLISS
ncbi:hypothetical protein IMCC3317_28830 [Kordia antarctica]|uniref:Uncharacterized protein n=1 Tax=Kordia antarctica TaxID=1218801 RepID=A0A7L4ZNM8_9FLAO|nr:hypothetical protein [Kordia antarctica]QHI37504.1 hypothetical protein IMCC3317_28830 [Kordia antarctica]